MLPIYASYFVGQNTEEHARGTLRNALGFVLGFTVVFAYNALSEASFRMEHDSTVYIHKISTH